MWPMQMMSATVNADLMRFYGEYAYGSISNIPRTTVLYCTPIPRLTHILVSGKNRVTQNHVSGTVRMFQLTQNSPTNANIS